MQVIYLSCNSLKYFFFLKNSFIQVIHADLLNTVKFHEAILIICPHFSEKQNACFMPYMHVLSSTAIYGQKTAICFIFNFLNNFFFFERSQIPVIHGLVLHTMKFHEEILIISSNLTEKENAFFSPYMYVQSGTDICCPKTDILSRKWQFVSAVTFSIFFFFLKFLYSSQSCSCGRDYEVT